MSATTVYRPAAVGTTLTPVAVAASDTVAAADLGTRGAYLIVANASGGSINVTVSDSGVTPAGNVSAPAAVAVANNATRGIFVAPSQVNPSTLVATVTYSATTSVTSYLLPLG